MSWLFYALLAPAIYAVVVFIDKYLLSTVIKNYNIMPIYMGIMGLIAGTFSWVVFKFPLLLPGDIFILFSAGILISLSSLIYYKALSFEEASTVNILFQMIPLITLVFSFIFLKELISFKQFIGFILILSATLAMSIKKESNKLTISTAFFLMLLYDVMWVGSTLLIKVALDTVSVWHAIPYESWGIGIGGLLIYIFLPTIRKSFHNNLKTVTRKTLGIILLNESGFILGKSLTFFAISLGPVSLVNLLENTQVFFAIFFGAVLTFIAPKTFHESISRKGLTKKIIAAISVFIGIILLN